MTNEEYHKYFVPAWNNSAIPPQELAEFVEGIAVEMTDHRHCVHLRWPPMLTEKEKRFLIGMAGPHWYSVWQVAKIRKADEEKRYYRRFARFIINRVRRVTGGY